MKTDYLQKYIDQYKEDKDMGSGADTKKTKVFESHANETQVGGNHYKQDEGIQEHWDRVADLKLNYFEAQITKYVERCRKKEDMLKDLRKAQHFITKYIELVEQGRIEDPTINKMIPVDRIHDIYCKYPIAPCTCGQVKFAPAHLASTI